MEDMSIINVSLKEIDTPFQIRSEQSEALSEESIRQLAEEMKANGIWDLAIPARKVGERFEIACGHRRLRAYKVLKLDSIRLDVKARTDEEMRNIAAAENMAREPLSQDEERAIVAQLAPAQLSEVARLLGISERTVSAHRAALRAIEESGATARPEVSSCAIAEAFPLGPGAQKRVAESSEVSRHEVRKAKKALGSVREKCGNEAYEKCKADLDKGKLEVDAEAILKAGKKYQRAADRKARKSEKKRAKPPMLEKLVQRWTDEFRGRADFFREKLLGHSTADELFEYLRQFKTEMKKFRDAMRELTGIFEEIEKRLS